MKGSASGWISRIDRFVDQRKSDGLRSIVRDRRALFELCHAIGRLGDMPVVTSNSLMLSALDPKQSLRVSTSRRFAQ